MKLEDYLKNDRMTQADYALALGVTQQMVSRWIKRGALVDSNGWVYPKYVPQNRGES